MRYPEPLVDAVLLRRYKRFLADVALPGGEEVTAWCPNPGSMKSLHTADEPACRVAFVDDPKRKLKWTLEQIEVDGAWVMAHPGRANAVVGEALAAERVPELAGYDAITPEQRYGSRRSRIDFLLTGGAGPDAYVEVKNVTLAEGRAGAFPDSVSARGTKHLRELMEVVEAGARGVLLFHVGRPDVDHVRPADAIDPEYGATLREAAAAGVEVLAYRCAITRETLRLADPLPVDLSCSPPSAGSSQRA